SAVLMLVAVPTVALPKRGRVVVVVGPVVLVVVVVGTVDVVVDVVMVGGFVVVVVELVVVVGSAVVVVTGAVVVVAALGIYSACAHLGRAAPVRVGAGSTALSFTPPPEGPFTPAVRPMKCTVAWLVGPVSTPSQWVPGASVTGLASGGPIPSPLAAAVTIRSGP